MWRMFVRVIRLTKSSLNTWLLVCRTKRVFGLGRPFAKLAAFAGTLLQRFIKIHHLGNDSSSIGVDDEEVETSRVWVETGTRGQTAIVSTSDFYPAMTLSVLQPASLQAGRNEEVYFSWPLGNLTPVDEEILLLSGSEGRESAVIALIEKVLKKLSRSGLQQMVQMSDGSSVAIFGREQDVSGVVLPIRRRITESAYRIDVVGCLDFRKWVFIKLERR